MVSGRRQNQRRAGWRLGCAAEAGRRPQLALGVGLQHGSCFTDTFPRGDVGSFGVHTVACQSVDSVLGVVGVMPAGGQQSKPGPVGGAQALRQPVERPHAGVDEHQTGQLLRPALLRTLAGDAMALNLPLPGRSSGMTACPVACASSAGK